MRTRVKNVLFPLLAAVFSTILITLLSPALAYTGNAQTSYENAKRLIERNVPVMVEAIETRYFDTQGNRLVIFGVILLILFPAITFVFSLIYQSINKNKIAQGAGGNQLFNKAGIVTLVVFLMGLLLWILQFWLASLGSVLNPQLVYQTQALDFILENREGLVDSYGDLFVVLADEVGSTPDLMMASVILNIGLKVKSDPLLEFMVTLVDNLWKFLGLFFWITIVAILLLFMRRIWPDIKRLLLMSPPVPVPAQAPPPGYGYPQPYPGQPYQPQQSKQPTLWTEGKKLIVQELKIILVYGLLIFLICLIVSGFMIGFFYPVAGYTVELTSVMTLYYVLPEGSSFVVVLATALMALFLLESMILFFITFLFFSDKVMEILRWRFSGKFGWKVAFQLFWRYFWRFLLIIAIATILAALLVSMAYWLTSTLGRAENPNFLLLLTVPLLLMHFGLNLGLLLFQCYRLMFSLGRARVKNDAALLGVTIV